MIGVTYSNKINNADVWWEDDILEDESDNIKIYDLITYPSDFTVNTIFEKLNNGTISIPPFQRNYVWEIKQASKLIESLIIGLPVPQMFFFEEEDKSLIIDGQQRLLTVFYFMHGRIPKQNKRASLRKTIIERGNLNDELLNDNEYFVDFKLKLLNNDELNGLSFENLGKYKEKFKSRPIRIMHIKQLAPNEQDKESSMFEIFDRLNTGGTNLSDQEIRMNIYYSSFYKMIDELNLNNKWRRLLGKEELDLRFKDFEILLRCIALANSFDEYKSAMKTFLNFYSHNAKSFDDTTIKNIKKEFEIFLESFELDDDDTKNKKNFQIGAIEAIYYVWLEKYKSGNTVKITKQIEENIKKDISAFQKSNRSTTSKDSIEARIEIARKWIS
jgi:uncharacterized protein with ParB-like and HNH nuclease domain